MVNPQNFVKNFHSARGSDNDGNVPTNAIDVYEATRFSSKAEPFPFLEFVFSSLVKGVAAIDIGFYKGKERSTLLSVSYSQKAVLDKDVNETEKIPDGYAALGAFQSSGTTTGFQRMIFDNPIDAQVIRIVLDKNTDETPWLSITSARAILKEANPENPIPGPANGHEAPKEEQTTEQQEKLNAENKSSPPVVENSNPPGQTAGENQSVLSNGVLIMAKLKQGGFSNTKFEVKRSNHDQTKEKDIDRDSIFAIPKFIKDHVVNAVRVMYVKTKLSASDQIDWKTETGKHTSGTEQERKQGRAVASGIQITPGKPSTVFLAKEYPAHSDTPKFNNKVVLLIKEPLPDLNDKCFGLQLVTYVSKAKTKVYECFIDLSVLDKNPEDLKTPPNNFEPLWRAEDKGDWIGEPYLDNQGIKFGGENMVLYGRIDHVTYPTKVNFAGVGEIEPKS